MVRIFSWILFETDKLLKFSNLTVFYIENYFVQFDTYFVFTAAMIVNMQLLISAEHKI